VKISGFTFARNADTLYYPVVESIRSILPVCDEVVVCIGAGTPGDRTRELVAAIGDPKITIIDVEWEESAHESGQHIFGKQTNIALEHCSGEWCFYIQADEAVHENDLPEVVSACERYLDDPRVEGFLFNYRHFWGDYDHYLINHHWYPREIRVIRNGIGIRSWHDAQSFRKNGKKIRVVPLDAYIFHYGWVRPPRVMRSKQKAFSITYRGKEKTNAQFEGLGEEFDYGSLEKLAVYKGTHPSVMKEWIARMDWKDTLQYTGHSKVTFKHDRLKYRILTFLEQKLLGGRQIGGFKNYRLIRSTRNQDNDHRGTQQ
jgi:glycosyltransferase involved in cell wall biosynthesis